MIDLICPSCGNNINDQETGTWLINSSGNFECECWECTTSNCFYCSMGYHSKCTGCQCKKYGTCKKRTIKWNTISTK